MTFIFREHSPLNWSKRFEENNQSEIIGVFEDFFLLNIIFSVDKFVR